MKYNITSNEGVRESVTVFGLGPAPLVATKDHPKFVSICRALQGEGPWRSSPATEQEILGMFDMAKGLANRFVHLSERVTLKGEVIYFDGDEVHDALASKILEFFFAEEEFLPLVNFMEKCYTNPLAHSRENLFRWLQTHRFAICPDGDFIAYKGVDRRSGTDKEDIFLSKQSGSAIVGGLMVQGKIPNTPGTIIEMPRSQVQHDPANGCSTGLHVANWKFAKSYATSVLKVKVNPRDVVSVPTESNNDKMRVCRYKVLATATHEDETLLFAHATPTKRAVRATVERQMADEVDQPVAPVKKAAAKAAAKKAPAKKAAAASKKVAGKKAPAKKVAPRGEEVIQPIEEELPEHYEQFTEDQFNSLTLTELRWLVGQWEEVKLDVPVKKAQKADMIPKLVAAAAERLKTWK